MKRLLLLVSDGSVFSLRRLENGQIASLMNVFSETSPFEIFVKQLQTAGLNSCMHETFLHSH